MSIIRLTVIWKAQFLMTAAAFYDRSRLQPSSERGGSLKRAEESRWSGLQRAGLVLAAKLLMWSKFNQHVHHDPSCCCCSVVTLTDPPMVAIPQDNHGKATPGPLRWWAPPFVCKCDKNLLTFGLSEPFPPHPHSRSSSGCEASASDLAVRL